MREELAQLEQNVQLLIPSYKACRAENERLSQKLAEQESSLLRTQKQLEEWKWKAQGRAVGDWIGDEEEKKALRLQLDRLVAEIDKVLAKIHE